MANQLSCVMRGPPRTPAVSLATMQGQARPGFTSSSLTSGPALEQMKRAADRLLEEQMTARQRTAILSKQAEDAKLQIANLQDALDHERQEYAKLAAKSIADSKTVQILQEKLAELETHHDCLRGTLQELGLQLQREEQLRHDLSGGFDIRFRQVEVLTNGLQESETRRREAEESWRHEAEAFKSQIASLEASKSSLEAQQNSLEQHANDLERQVVQAKEDASRQAFEAKQCHDKEVKTYEAKVAAALTELDTRIHQVEDLTSKLATANASIAEGTKQKDELTLQQDQLRDSLEAKTAELDNKVAEICHLQDLHRNEISVREEQISQLELCLEEEKGHRSTDAETFAAEKARLEIDIHALQQEAQSMLARHALEIKQHSRDFEKKMNDFVEKADNEYQKRSAEAAKLLEELRQKSTAELTIMQNEKSALVAEKQQLAADLTELHARGNEERTALDMKVGNLESVVKSLEDKLSSTCTANARDTESLLEKHDAALQDLMRRHEDAMQEQQQALEKSAREMESLAGENKELKEKLANLAASSEAERVTHETKVSGLQSQVLEGTQALEALQKVSAKFEADLKGQQGKLAEALRNQVDADAESERALQEKADQIKDLERHLAEHELVIKELEEKVSQVEDELAEKATLLQRISMAAAPAPTPPPSQGRKRVAGAGYVSQAKPAKKPKQALPPRFHDDVHVNPRGKRMPGKDMAVPHEVEDMRSEDLEGDRSAEEDVGKATFPSTKIRPSQQPSGRAPPKAKPTAPSVRGRRRLLGTMSLKTLGGDESGYDTVDNTSDCEDVSKDVQEILRGREAKKMRAPRGKAHETLQSHFLDGGSAALDIFGKASFDPYAFRSPLGGH